MCIYTHTLLITFMLFKKLLLHSLYISFLQREMLNLCFLHKEIPPFSKRDFLEKECKARLCFTAEQSLESDSFS